MVWFQALLASFITSLVSLVGIFFLSFLIEKLKKIIMFLVSLSAGALLGGAFFHLLPEALEISGSKTWSYVLVGILIFFILEKIIHWRHCHEPSCDEHPHSLGVMNIIGDGLHNLIDGAVIAGAFLIDTNLGILTTIAVISHEVPQEIGDFGVLIYAGYSVKRALFFNFLSALGSVLGALIVLILNQKVDGLMTVLLPLTAGGFIYIASSDLIPELRKEIKISESLKQLLGIIIGLSLILVLDFFFHH